MTTSLDEAPADGAPKPPILNLLDQVDAVVGMICKVTVFVTGTFLLALLFVNVASRYLFDLPLGVIGEIPELLFPWMIMAGVVLAVQLNAHIAVDIVIKVFPLRARLAILLAIQALITVTYITVTKVALDVAAITAMEKSPVLKIPGSIGYYALAIGSLLLLIASIVVSIRIVVTGREPAAGSLGEGVQ